MTTRTLRGGQALRGKTILMSASVPSQKRAERYNRIEDAAFEIEQAVISLARAIFSEGGRLVFGGHPAISPLVAMVVGEYREPRFAESTEQRDLSPVDIYQSHAFDGFLPDDTLLMYKLGYASIRWVESVGREKFDPGQGDGETSCPNSLRKMREFMFKDAEPDAMVCIGGMEGLEEEVALALEAKPPIPIFVLERTGGACALLRQRLGDRLRMIDTEVVVNLQRLRSRNVHDLVDESASRRALVPYPLVMQLIVDEVSKA